ncbi:MAG: hypothetical protein ACJ764_04890 [Solirubrobacteraceae bacterium]
MAGVVHVQWYATVLRQEALALEICQAARIALRYGATQYSVMRSRDDHYKITQMAWFEDKNDWYRYWDGPEMIEFRRRNQGHYQVPTAYVWHDELDAGALGPEVFLPPAPEPEPEPEPGAVSG